MFIKYKNLELLKWYNMRIVHFDMTILPESRSMQLPNLNNHSSLELTNPIIIDSSIIRIWKLKNI